MSRAPVPSVARALRPVVLGLVLVLLACAGCPDERPPRVAPAPVAPPAEDAPQPLPDEVRRWWETGACPPGTTLRGALPPEPLRGPPAPTLEEAQARWGEHHHFSVGCVDADGRREGPSTTWRPSGETTTHHRAGRLDGPECRWSVGGRVTMLHHRADELHGLSATWEHGRLVKSSEWVDGERDGVARTWWPDGSLRQETHYLAGERHGPRRQWHESGGIYEDSLYDHGQAVRVTWTHATGVVHRVETYRAGQRHGRIAVFSSSGRLVETWVYVDGERVETIPGG